MNPYFVESEELGIEKYEAASDEDAITIRRVYDNNTRDEIVYDRCSDATFTSYDQDGNIKQCLTIPFEVLIFLVPSIYIIEAESKSPIFAEFRVYGHNPVGSFPGGAK